VVPECRKSFCSAIHGHFSVAIAIYLAVTPVGEALRTRWNASELVAKCYIPASDAMRDSGQSTAMPIRQLVVMVNGL
jgi:hypothetical protein